MFQSHGAAISIPADEEEQRSTDATGLCELVSVLIHTGTRNVMPYALFLLSLSRVAVLTFHIVEDLKLYPEMAMKSFDEQ